MCSSSDQANTAGFINIGFIDIGGFVNIRNRNLGFWESWLEAYGEFAWEWTDFWLSPAQGSGNLYKNEQADSGDLYLINYEVVDLPANCNTCVVSLTDAAECTEAAVKNSTGLATPFTTDENGEVNGTVTFDSNITSQIDAEFFNGKTIVMGFENGTAFACGTFQAAEDANTGTSASPKVSLGGFIIAAAVTLWGWMVV